MLVPTCPCVTWLYEQRQAAFGWNLNICFLKRNGQTESKRVYVDGALIRVYFLFSFVTVLVLWWCDKKLVFYFFRLLSSFFCVNFTYFRAFASLCSHSVFFFNLLLGLWIINIFSLIIMLAASNFYYFSDAKRQWRSLVHFDDLRRCSRCGSLSAREKTLFH